MKNQKLFMLVILVAGIWGTIGFKIYHQLDDEPVERAMPKSVARDTVTDQHLPLSFAYNDPFLKTPPKKSLEAAPRKSVVPRPKAVPPPVSTVDWTKIRYMGTVYNTSRKTLVATVKLGNTEYLLREGELFEGFSILRIHRDSVMIGYEKSTKYIKRE